MRSEKFESNTKLWKRAGLRMGTSCSNGKSRHGSSNPGTLFSLLPFAFCLLAFFTACEESFSPMQQNDQYPFSIHGYLDASQDTNWVRITAVRDSLFMDTPEPLDAVVTLEHLESGHTVTMNDSLFRYIPGNTYAYNYWTDMMLEPEQTYKLTVQRSDGVESLVTVTLPPDYPLPQIRPGRFNQDTLIVQNVQRLVDVRVLYDVYYHWSELTTSEDVLQKFTFKQQVETLSDTHHNQRLIMINVQFHLDAFPMIPIRHTIKKNEITVFSAGPDWINFSDLDENLISLPEGATNIEGGNGFLIGVISKTIQGSQHPP